MNVRRVAALAALQLLCVPLGAQRVIPLYPGTPPGSQPSAQEERAYYSPAWGTQVVVNVSRPTLTVYQPAPGKATGTAVVICPGGGFVALSINSEGVDVARWLAARGVTAFVLKYRLAHTGDDAVAEFSNAMKTPGAFQALTGAVIPLAIADGQNAVAYVRAHASEFGIAPGRVGIMGFSAGGTVVAALAYHYTAESRPAFLAPVYAYTGGLPANPVPADAPPMFVAAATDDDLGLAPQSVALYSAWLAARKPAELHIYAHGGHGFGMRTKHLSSDTWIERFGAWLDEQGLTTPLRAPTVQYRSPAGVAYRSQSDTGTVARAEHSLALDPKNVDKVIALGTAQAGVRDMRGAIATFTKGLAAHPNNAVLYRWRGHRHLSVREFAAAKADFARGLAIDSAVYGIWYHLGIVRFVEGKFGDAAAAFKRAQPLAPDAGELAGSTDWLWMSLARAGRLAEAKAMLDRHPDSLTVDDPEYAYVKRLRMYRGEVSPEQLITKSDTADVQAATLNFGLGNWYLVHGDTAKAKAAFERAVQSGGWPGFGFIVSEVELRRMK